jgi:branched-chain amino acid aminotransferase
VLAGAAHLTLSGSIRNISPVVALDGEHIEAGKTSLELQRIFQERAEDEIDP